MADKEIKLFKSGVWNLVDSEIIPTDAAQDSNNWYTANGRIYLVGGKEVVGASGAVGSVTGEIFGYKVDGSKVHWRKIGTKIQYLNGTTWTDVITGLTSSADYSFTNYSSLAGTFTFAGGVDGIFKMHNASPASYCTMYNSAKNFKGKILIDKGRMLLWDRAEDKTGLYGSYIDVQNSVVYTAVTGEAVAAVESGTLAFKAGGATRNCFGVVITDTSSSEVFTDNYLGVLVGSAGHFGTINYITGAFTITGQTGAGTASYQWEDSNAKGVTDFTKSSTRLAGEGFQFPQDEGGDPILNVLVGSNGYYSLKSQSTYLLQIGPTDLATGTTNEVYRKEMGMQSWRGAVSTGGGIVFMNLSKPEKPELVILEKNLVSEDLVPKVLFPQFKFANYNYNDCTLDTYERYIVVACKTLNAVNNDTILLCDIAGGTVDVTTYSARTFARSAGDLFIGSSIAQSVYKLFSGFDDDGNSIENHWIGKSETWETNKLKKYRKIRLKGNIAPEQSLAVYVNYDNSGYQLAGTVLGSGSYVDYSSPQAIGSNMVGESQIGGDDLTNVYPYFMEIRLRKVPKFRNRTIKLMALGIGYVDVDSQMDMTIDTYENKIPNRFRLKQNVSLDGAYTDMNSPSNSVSADNQYILTDSGVLLLTESSELIQV
jgi:hypothetical protein